MQTRFELYINGTWTKPHGKETYQVIDPSTENPFGEVALADLADVNQAVSAAQKAFKYWSTTSPSYRANFLRKIVDALKAQSGLLASTISQEMGAPRKMAEMIQVGMPIGVMNGYADLLEQFHFEETLGNSKIYREPIGVVAMITPWNYPLHQIIGKVAPALAAGCTLVLKPSEQTPFTAYILADICDQVGLPAGVFNLIPGLGPIVGEALASHPAVDMVSFTGSTQAGIRVAQLAASTVKRVAQELGGKSANIICADADLQKAVTAGTRDVFFNSGQTCSALTRMLVPRANLEQAELIAAEIAKKTKLGPASDPTTQMGPVSSKRQQERIRHYIHKGIAEGAKLVVGGPEQPEDLPLGCFVKPTVFSEVQNHMAIAREEIFGPVLSILPYDSEKEAVEIANDSLYGLSGSVWSGDPDKAIAIARQLRTGQVSINGGRWNGQAPFGGYKQSGNGRELGPHGLHEYLELKAIQI